MKMHELGSRDCPVCGDCETCDNPDYEEMSEDWEGSVYYNCPMCGLEIVYEEIDFWSDSEEGADEHGWKVELTLFRRSGDDALWVRKEELKSEGDGGWHGCEDYFPTTIRVWCEKTGH